MVDADEENDRGLLSWGTVIGPIGGAGALAVGRIEAVG
jgi:hypothetical protein